MQFLDKVVDMPGVNVVTLFPHERLQPFTVEEEGQRAAWVTRCWCLCGVPDQFCELRNEMRHGDACVIGSRGRPCVSRQGVDTEVAGRWV